MYSINGAVSISWSVWYQGVWYFSCHTWRDSSTCVLLRTQGMPSCCCSTSTSTGKIPQQWNQAIVRLIPKNSAEDKPNDLSCFRPIALTSCVGKLYTSILKERLVHFMTSNNYIVTATQKAFIEGVPGCTEHQFKLWQAILVARTSQCNITVCRLDLANAFGSIHHNLISYALWHYHLAARLAGKWSFTWNCKE